MAMQLTMVMRRLIMVVQSMVDRAAQLLVDSRGTFIDHLIQGGNVSSNLHPYVFRSCNLEWISMMGYYLSSEPSKFNWPVFQLLGSLHFHYRCNMQVHIILQWHHRVLTLFYITFLLTCRHCRHP